MILLFIQKIKIVNKYLDFFNIFLRKKFNINENNEGL